MALSEPLPPEPPRTGSDPELLGLSWGMLAGLIILVIAAAAAGIHTAQRQRPSQRGHGRVAGKKLSASRQAVAVPSLPTSSTV